jgi:large subunit ribosomal protein L24
MISIKNKHVKLGDTVKIIAGSQKGIIGTISFLNKKKALAIISGVERRIKFLKKQNNNSEKGSKQIEIEKLIHVSNLMLWDKVSNNCSRIGYKIVNQQKKRYFKKSGYLL